MVAVRSGDIRLPYPHGGQRAVRAQARRFNWLAAGRRWRKTTLLMTIAVEEALRGKQILWCAPVFDQVRIGWNETRRAANGVAEFNMSRMTAWFPSGGVITYRSLDNPDNARGHTADGVVIDEVGDVQEDAWYEVLRPMLIDTNGWAWGIGTPRGFNWFYHEWQRAKGRSDSASWQVPTVGARIEDGRLIRDPHPLENPAIPFAEIEQLFDTTPRDTFEREILSRFNDSAITIYSPEWWDGRNRYDPGELVHANLYAGRYLSWDTAFQDKESAAYSACVVGEMVAPEQRGREWTLQIRDVYRDRLPFPRLVDESVRLIDKWNTDGKLRAVLIEDKASGQSLVQTLRSAMPRYADAIVGFAPRGDKATRAGQASVWCRNGCVLLPEPGSAPWLKAFETELYAAPNGLNNDMADAFAQLVFYLEHYLAEGWRLRNGAIRAA